MDTVLAPPSVQRRVGPAAGGARRGSRGGGVIVGCLVVVAGLFGLMLGFSPTLNPVDLLTGKGFDVVVPKITGLTQTRALIVLENGRLEGKVSFAYSATTQRGLVMSQSPAAGGTVGRGAAVDVVVSRGLSRVSVPDLIGQDESAATATLATYGLEPRVDRVNDETAPKGQVFGQKPQAGVVTSGGTSVNLTVSLGPAQRAVPDLARLPTEGALFLLGKSGFTLGPVTFADNNDVQTGAVIGTDPAASTMLDRDAKVGLVISSGPAPVAVPDMTNRRQQDAAKELGDLGFVVGEITQIGLPGDPQDGVVLGQSPAPGVQLRPGDVVSLTVRRAAKPTPTSAPTTAPPPPTPPPTTPAPAPATAPAGGP